MKTTLQALLIVFLFAGMIAAVSYPTQSKTIAPVGIGMAPAPSCSPWDSDCAPAASSQTSEESAPAVEPATAPTGPVSVGPAPMPVCSPWDDTCDRGPYFPPKHTAEPIAVGPAPMPVCSPWDDTCDRGPYFPPKHAAEPIAVGPAPMPVCSPWDDTCDRGPYFPQPKIRG